MAELRKSAVSIPAPGAECPGRPVSRPEAVRIARQILLDAERQRLEIAAVEAGRGIPIGA